MVTAIQPTATMPTTVSTSSVEIDKKLGGGIPIGSLSLIEGQSDAGKSVLSQHLAYGSLLSDVGVVYYTTENTVRSPLTQMASLSLDVTDHFLVDLLRVYPLNIAGCEMDAKTVFERLSAHIELLPAGFKVIILDSLTNIVTHSGETSVLDFFLRCKELCENGRTIILVVHSYAFDDGMLIRIRSMCDAHLNPNPPKDGWTLGTALEEAGWVLL